MIETKESPSRTHGDYELRQLVGQRKNKRSNRIITIPTDMDQVLHCGERIGYVGRHNGAPFCPLVPKMAPDRVQETLDVIKSIREKDGFFGVPGEAGRYPDGVTPELIADAQRTQRAREDDDDDEE
jgi:hypothetical protein